MATRLRTLLIAVVVLVVAYTAAAWLIGIDVQSQLESREQQALKDAPYVVLIKHEYRRGIYGATEESTYGLKGPLARMGSLGSPAGPNGSPLQLTVRNTIQHGPLPWLRAALAVVDTDLIPAPGLARKLDAIFGGRPAVKIRTSLGWFGGSTTDFSMPAFRAQLPASATMSLQGLSGSAETARNLASWSARIASGGFDIQGPQGKVDFGDMSFDAKMRRVFDEIYVGDGHVKLASVAVQRASGPLFLLEGFSVASTSKADSEYVDSEADIAADRMNAGNFSFTHVVYAIRVTHLEGTALASLTQALRKVQAGVGPGGALAARANMQDALSRYGVELLVHDPVLEIPRLGFAMPEGEFQLAAKLAAHGIRREDLQGGPASLIALTRYLDATVDLRIDAALLSKLLASTPRGPALSAQLESLQKQGYLKRDGMAWVAQIAYHGGSLTINGQRYPPAPAF